MDEGQRGPSVHRRLGSGHRSEQPEPPPPVVFAQQQGVERFGMGGRRFAVLGPNVIREACEDSPLTFAARRRCISVKTPSLLPK